MKAADAQGDIDDLQDVYDAYDSADKLKIYNSIAGSGKGGTADSKFVPQVRSNMFRALNSPNFETGLMDGLRDRLGLGGEKKPGDTSAPAPPAPPAAPTAPPDGEHRAGALHSLWKGVKNTVKGVGADLWYDGPEGLGEHAADEVGKGVADATGQLAGKAQGQTGNALGQAVAKGDFEALGSAVAGEGGSSEAHQQVAKGMAETLPKSVASNFKNPLLSAGADLAGMASGGLSGIVDSAGSWLKDNPGWAMAGAAAVGGLAGSLFGGGGGSGGNANESSGPAPRQSVEQQRGSQLSPWSGKAAALCAELAKAAAGHELMGAFAEAGRNWGKTIGEMAAPRAEELAGKAVKEIAVPWVNQNLGTTAGGLLTRAVNPGSNWGNAFNLGKSDEEFAEVEGRQQAEADDRWMQDTEYTRNKNLSEAATGGINKRPENNPAGGWSNWR